MRSFEEEEVAPLRLLRAALFFPGSGFELSPDALLTWEALALLTLVAAVAVVTKVAGA